MFTGSPAKPSVSILIQTNDQAELECLVEGAFPKPNIEWLDSDSNTLLAEEPQVTPRGDKFDTILRTTVTKTGRYRCVATQMEIHHQKTRETYVYLNGEWDFNLLMIF